MQRSGAILVTGATGRQGGAVARELIAEGWPVRAMTRDTAAPAARDLAEAGAELVQADMLDPASLYEAMRGAYGVFSVQTWRGPGGTGAELRSGLAVADAAARAGIEHFTYSSVGGAERATGIPHFESKWRIEQHVRELGMPSTIWRPVSFMENFDFQRSDIEGGVVRASVQGDVALQMIAVRDIGRFVALGFQEPERFIGRAIEIAGDELTPAGVAAAFSDALGHEVTVTETDPAKVPAESAMMMRWFAEHGYEADIPALRRELPGLWTLRDWIAATGWDAVG